MSTERVPSFPDVLTIPFVERLFSWGIQALVVVSWVAVAFPAVRSPSNMEVDEA